MSLPFLSSQFFEQISPQPPFWLKWQNQGPWSAEFVPLYEWDGVLFVGCGERSSKSPLKLSFDCVYISASQEALEKFYNSLLALSSKATTEALSDPTPKSTEFSFDQLPELEVPNSPATPDFEALDLGLGSDQIPNSTSTTSQSSEFNFDHLSLEPSAVAATAGSDFNFEALDLNTNSQPVNTSDLSGSAGAPQFQFESLKLDPEPNAEAESQMSEDTAFPGISIEEALAEEPVMLAQNMPPQNELHSQTFSLGPDLLDDVLTGELFLKLQNHFEKSMLLRKTGNGLTPWKWDAAFHCKNSEPTPVSLTNPSPFRIVAKTGKPYHGKIVPGEIQERFFEEWNQSQVPDHLTMVPIFVKSEMIGVLLSVADSAVNLKASLHLAEKTAEDFSTSLQALGSTTAA